MTLAGTLIAGGCSQPAAAPDNALADIAAASPAPAAPAPAAAAPAAEPPATAAPALAVEGEGLRLFDRQSGAAVAVR